MNTIIAYKENDKISFVSAGGSYYGACKLDTKISGLRVLQNGLTIATPLPPDMECMLEILDHELGSEEAVLNEDYLKDTFIPALYRVLNSLDMIEVDSETNVDSLRERMLIAKDKTLYLINYDFDFWYVPGAIAIGVEQNTINMILNNYSDHLNNKEDMINIIKLCFKYRKESLDSFYYLNTKDLKDGEL